MKVLEPVGEGQDQYWARPATEVLARLTSRVSGLSSDEARARLATCGANSIERVRVATALGTFLRQFRSPLVLILIFAAAVSGFLGDISDAAIISVIVIASSALSFTQEYSASKAMDALRKRVSTKVQTLRDGVLVTLSSENLVPGDIVRLSAGNLVPADGILLEANNLNVSEAALTGETYPAVKEPGVSNPDAGIAKRCNALYAGTSVRSGTADFLVVKTGGSTEFAAIAAVIQRRIPETDFSKGIRHFGYLMTEIMLAIVIVVLAANLLLHRPLIDSLLFSLALAVGLTPELLPAIISVTLSRGARAMAADGVIVRRLEAIENLGSMTILCTDKTGTLTAGVIDLNSWFDADGAVSSDVLLWAQLNAALQTGLSNPLDEAIAASMKEPVLQLPYTRISEIPYDFIRKRLSVVVKQDGLEEPLVICKGAVQNVLECCVSVYSAAKVVPLNANRLAAIDVQFKAWSEQGYRVLALATRRVENQAGYGRDIEAEMVLAGFLLFLDPPKPGIRDALDGLRQRGVSLKMITGDNRYVAANLARQIGLSAERIVTGDDLTHMTKNVLFGVAPQTDLFVEIDPNQKERIVEALRSHDHVVGYLGDGINDAPALHEADIGISVDGAVDVAREAADMILLQQDLSVLLRGIDNGRRTFANTMKYISINTSASFGNMISMAAASMFLPFLPLLAKQILLNNLLSSLPSLAIASDNVDLEQITKPRRWDIGSVRRFMISFGLISTAFDALTFGFLLVVLKASVETFRTAWFVESLLTQLAIVLIIRTYKSFWVSRPSRLLSSLTLAVAVLALSLPYLPFAGWLGFLPLPPLAIAGIVTITLTYMAVSELTKQWFFGPPSPLTPPRQKMT
jgi:Mg2+-importing ATPase